MKKRVITIIIIVGVTIFLILGAIFMVAYKELEEEAILKKEIINYTNKDLLTDDFEVEVKTTGDRAYIEEAIKNYYKDLAENMQSVANTISNEELQNILSVESIMKDRPSYQNGHRIITETREKVNNDMDKIKKACEEEYIKGLIDKDKLSDPEYYYDLYLDLVYTDADIEDIKAASDQIEQTTTQLNQFFDIVERMLNFLETNDSYLGYENGQFYFTDLEVSNQFQAYIEKLDELANQMTVEEGKTESDTI